MSKAIPLDLLIDVTSAGVRDTFSLGKASYYIDRKSKSTTTK